MNKPHKSYLIFIIHNFGVKPRGGRKIIDGQIDNLLKIKYIYFR